jgi:glutamate synthase (NADPH/NADH) small chain
MRLRTSSSHEEGGRRHWQILTRAFLGDGGRVGKLQTVDVAFDPRSAERPGFNEIAGSEREWPADLVLLALGFSGPELDTLAARLGLDLDERGTIRTTADYMALVPGVFAAGDARRGQSLIVWAISEGREAARSVDVYLTGRSDLPANGPGDLPRIR